MKKAKLLFPIIGVPALMATLIPTVVSCNPTPIDPTDEEKIIMPEAETQEAQYEYEDENYHTACAYIIIKDFKWVNPQHTFDDIGAVATPDGETEFMTEIIPDKKQDNTFDVKVILCGDQNCYEAKTNLNFNLTIEVWNEETGEWEQFSDAKQYSMFLGQAIVTSNAIYAPNPARVIELEFYILNGAKKIQQIHEGDESIKIEGDLDVYEGLADKPTASVEFNEYYSHVTVEFCLNKTGVIPEYDGKPLKISINFDYEDGSSEVINDIFNLFSEPTIIRPGEISLFKLTKTDDNTYEADSVENSFVWMNPEPAVTSVGDLDWECKQYQLDDLGIKSIEVTPITITDNAVHFKFITTTAPEGEPLMLDFNVSYKNIRSNIYEEPFEFILKQ